MRQFFILAAASQAFVLPGQAQIFLANRHLSNLHSPTAVNVHLLPCRANEINLGSSHKPWKNFYIAGNVYKGGNRFISSDTLGNTFLGISAGKVNTGTENTAVGRQALYSNTTGFQNTATGYQALFNNTTGVFNQAFGYQALFNNTEGFGNHAFGSEALQANTTGYFNSAFGGRALWTNTIGGFNVANGIGALQYNTEGSSNVGCGSFALNENSTGNGNTAIGDGAIWSNTANSNNTAIGNNAGGGSLDFSNATFLGAQTNADSGLSNFTAIGYQAHSTASNQVAVGNSSVTSIGGYANWSNFSDGRYKKNVREDVPGLEFISQLRPVTYTLDMDGIASTKKNPVQVRAVTGIQGLNGRMAFPADALEKAGKQQSSEELKARQEKSKVVYTGFIAQEVEQAARKLNYNFSGVDAPKSEKSFYALRYGDFVVPLVKAVQEQQKQINEQQKQIEELKSLMQSISKQAFSNTEKFSSSVAYLKQNAPNPFNKNTVISYYIPGNASNAEIILTDMNGSLIKTFTAPKGEGQINISGGELPAAAYNYTLFINGKKTETKQMIIIK